jgi:hypothetical protein
MAVIPLSSQAGSDQLPAEHALWCVTINGWVKDQRIRRDALIAFGMLLATAIIIVWIIFHSGGSALSEVLAAVSSTALGKIALSVAAITGASIGCSRLLRQRNRHSAMPPPRVSTASTVPTDFAENTTQDSLGKDSTTVEQ